MKKYKQFIIGFLIGALLFGSITVFAEHKQIQTFYNDIKISLDGKLVELKDAKGKNVEPFIIEGTTYLPVRALAEMLGMEVKYNETTNTVELAKKKGGNFEMKVFDPSKVKESFELGMNGILWDVCFYVTPEELKNKFPFIDVIFKESGYLAKNNLTNKTIEVKRNETVIAGFPSYFEYNGDKYINHDCINPIIPMDEIGLTANHKPSIEYYNVGNLDITYVVKENKEYVDPHGIVKAILKDDLENNKDEIRKTRRNPFDIKCEINKENNTVDFIYEGKSIKDYPVIHRTGNVYLIPYDDYRNDLYPKLMKLVKEEKQE